MDRLLSMRTFARVVDEGSFAGAARRLDINQAVVTRLVADLESHLGARLLHRTTRSLSLTDAGERYLARCRQILADVDAAEEAAGDGEKRIGGRVRIAVPAAFALRIMATRGARFRALYPDIVLDVSLVDRPIDLVGEGYDLAVIPSAFGVPSSLISRSLGKKQIVLCAAPQYLKEWGTPERPEDLLEHRCLGYNLLSQREMWRLTHRDGETVNLPVSFVMQTNSLAYVHQSMLAGLGIGPQVPYKLCNAIQSGELVHVLPDWTLGTVEMVLVYASREHMPRRIRAVIDFFVEERDAILREVAELEGQAAESDELKDGPVTA